MAKPVRLKDQSILIDAPREMIYQKMAAFNQGRYSDDSAEYSKITSRDGDSLVVEFKIKAGIFTYKTVENITLYAPERITFDGVSGPLDYSYEEFVFEDVDGQTKLTHTGEILWKRFPFFGWLGTLIYTRPMFHRVIDQHLVEVKVSCEARAARSHVFKRRKRQPSESQS
ncbi:MAG: hypothetical protein QF898_15040 [SAR202 cluster bacterium]|jgi:hypothetical protein|nr:hypothetical protein [SAR202 cluster bacterium]MDP6514781.1 hypothetical protein [SAR202 cluster bacterium]MDP6713209.1 hypothetical protein [SAR202 cluster bacterium]